MDERGKTLRVQRGRGNRQQVMIKSLEITTGIGCSNACAFCPQVAVVRNYPAHHPKQFTPDYFEKCLSTVPIDCRVHFSGFAEAMLNETFPEMWVLAHSRGHAIHLYSTLVGLREAWLPTLVKYAPEYTRIHVPDLDGFQYPDEQWIALHELFRQTALPAHYMAMTPLISPAVNAYLHEFGIKVKPKQMRSRGGNVKIVPQVYRHGRIRCAEDRWHRNTLLPNGDVLLCCEDYGMEVRLGNLLKQSYAEIYEAAEGYRAITDPPSDFICRRCYWSEEVR